MTSVLVVSRNASLGMWLSRNGADVDESRPDRVDGWTDDVPGHAVLLLDLGTVDQAEHRLKGLVSEGLRVPVLLIGGDAPEWEQLAGRFSSGLTLFLPPLNAAAVLEELDRLATGSQLDTFASRPAGSVISDSPAPEVPPPLPEIVAVTRKEKPPEAAGSGPSAVPVISRPARSPDSRDHTSGLQVAVVDVPAPRPEPPPVAVQTPTAVQVTPSVQATPFVQAITVVAPLPTVEFPPVAVPVRALRLPPAPAPLHAVEPHLVEAVVGAQLEPQVESAPATDWGITAQPVSPAPAREAPRHGQRTSDDVQALSSLELVSALRERVDGFYSVNDVADFVLAEMVERSEATAGAALMRAGDMWLVEAGVGLRPLEGRLKVPTQHWLVRRVVEEKLGLLVTRSDGSGHELLGAPLASWEHLAGVYLPEGELLILLASADQPFTEGHLKAVRNFDDECKDLLREACAVRELARLLAPLADSDFES